MTMFYKVFLRNVDEYEIWLCNSDDDKVEHVLTMWSEENGTSVCEALNDAYKRGFQAGRD
jgi:hypothetical protein